VRTAVGRNHALMGLKQWVKLRLEMWIASRSIPPVDSNRVKQLWGNDSGPSGTFDHSKWDALLKAHTTAGATFGGVTDVTTVDYEGIAVDPRFKLYLSALAAAKLDALSPTEMCALLINAYNAFTISLITEHEKASGERLPSINALSKKGSVVWDLPAGILGGKQGRHSPLQAGKAYSPTCLFSCRRSQPGPDRAPRPSKRVG
jgi:hypothetical protein